MNNLFQLLASGLMAGGIYALIALGIVIIYKSSQVFNFAQGDFVMMGAFVIWGLLIWSGLPFWLSLIIGIGIIAVVGLLVERLLLRPLIGQPLIAAMMMTIGLSYILKGLVALIWGNVVVAFPQILPSGVLHLGSVVISYQALTGFILGLITIGIFVIIFRYTRVGLRMRATAEDSQLAQSTGVKVRSIFAISWATTATVGLIGGVLLGNIVGISPSLGDMGLAAAFPAVLLGGLESIPGVVIGGLCIGILQSLAAGYVDPLVGGGVKEVAPYVVLVVILFIRPHGLLGLKRIERI